MNQKQVFLFDPVVVLPDRRIQLQHVLYIILLPVDPDQTGLLCMISKAISV